MKKQIFTLLLLPSVLFGGYEGKPKTEALARMLKENVDAAEIKSLEMHYDGKSSRTKMIKTAYKKLVKGMSSIEYLSVYKQVDEECKAKIASGINGPLHLFSTSNGCSYWQRFADRLVEEYAKTEADGSEAIDFLDTSESESEE